MAEKSKRTKGSKSIAEAALSLIAESGWRALSMAELARASGRSLPQLYREVPSRRALLRQIGEHLDEAMLSGSMEDFGEMSVRERLFDLLMRRLDAMQAQRGAFTRLAEDGRSAALMAATFCNVDRACGRALDASGIRLHGLAARGARRALGLAYGRTVRSWLRDDSEDMAATMAELDKRLGELDRAAGLAAKLCRLGRRAAPPSGEAAAA